MPEPPTEQTLLGNFVHSILEEFYKQEPEQRTLASVRTLAASIWESYKDDVTAILRKKPDLIKDFRWKAWWCIENLLAMEDPTTLSFSGIETELYAHIDGVLIKGFVDRWFDDGDGIVIGDYKTGKVPSRMWRAGKFDQLMIYGLILSEQLDKPLSRLELLYVAYGEKLDHIPTEEDIETTKQRVKSVRAGIDLRCKTGEFEPIKGKLCSWCAFQSICPAWQ